MDRKYRLPCFSLGLILLAQPAFAGSVIIINNLTSTSSLILILFGIILMLAELGLPSSGALALGGLTFLIAGIGLLYAADSPLLRQAWPVFLAIIMVYLLVLLFVLLMAIKAKQRKRVSGQETLIGQTAIVVSDFVNQQGWIRVEGELWQAQAEQPLRTGAAVKITQIDGLKLLVQPLQR